MNSIFLKEYGFKKWHKLTHIKEERVNVSESSGVYILRLNRKFKRLQGESDILYIGCTGNLRERIVENHINGRGGKTTKRIHKYLFAKGYAESVEVSWILLDDVSKDAREKMLLEEYKEQHHELPPWNRSG